MKVTDCLPCAQARVRFYVKKAGRCAICGSAFFEDPSPWQWIFRRRPRLFRSCDCGPGPVITEAMRVDDISFGVIAWR